MSDKFWKKNKFDSLLKILIAFILWETKFK